MLPLEHFFQSPAFFPSGFLGSGLGQGLEAPGKAPVTVGFLGNVYRSDLFVLPSPTCSGNNSTGCQATHSNTILC